jgi:hypothetical protein
MGGFQASQQNRKAVLPHCGIPQPSPKTTWVSRHPGQGQSLPNGCGLGEWSEKDKHDRVSQLEKERETEQEKEAATETQRRERDKGQEKET